MNTIARREYEKNRKIKRKELGLCHICNNKSTKGKTKCAKHLEVDRLRCEKKRIRRKAAGICIRCNRPVCLKSVTYCETHQQDHYARICGSARGRQIDVSISKKDFEEWHNLQQKVYRKHLSLLF